MYDADAPRFETKFDTPVDPRVSGGTDYLSALTSATIDNSAADVVE